MSSVLVAPSQRLPWLLFMELLRQPLKGFTTHIFNIINETKLQQTSDYITEAVNYLSKENI